jgi:hypothetical protein
MPKLQSRKEYLQEALQEIRRSESRSGVGPAQSGSAASTCMSPSLSMPSSQISTGVGPVSMVNLRHSAYTIIKPADILLQHIVLHVSLCSLFLSQ